MAKHVAHHKHVAVLIVHADAVHPQELGQQSVAMALHNVLVVVGEVAMHVSNVLTGYFFDDQSPIIGDKEATITAFTFTWGTSGKGHQVILVINAKSITEVPEDLGTILLELEMTGQEASRLLGGEGEREENWTKGRKDVFLRATKSLLNRACSLNLAKRKRRSSGQNIHHSPKPL